MARTKARQPENKRYFCGLKAANRVLSADKRDVPSGEACGWESPTGIYRSAQAQSAASPFHDQRALGEQNKNIGLWGDWIRLYQSR
jgi:hypothetical protein